MRIPDDLNTIVQLHFTDPRLAELDVRVRRSFGLVDSSADLSTIDADAFQAGTPSPGDLAKIRQLVNDFADALVTWNLTDDQDQPLPTDRDTVRALDIMLVLMLVAAFDRAITTLRQEIAEVASQVNEAEIPMEPLNADA